MPQPALNINMDAHTQLRVAVLHLRQPAASELPTVYVYNELTKVPIPIPIPNITPLSPPLGLVEPIPVKLKPIDGVVEILDSQGGDDRHGQGRAHGRRGQGRGLARRAALRPGVAAARRLVGVRGAGMAFDGLHYVQSVTHHIKRGEYKQRFKLVRNGLISTLPSVPA